MNPKNSYYRLISIATVLVMLWNIAGWLGFGIIMHHVHTHGEGHHCEIMLCNCKVEDGNKICTCHHNDLKGHEQKTDGNHHQETCHYTASHSNNSTSTSLVVSTKYNALQSPVDELIFPPGDITLSSSEIELTLSGVAPDLLRPPRV